MGKLVGIDLGTTNSVVAVMDGPRPRVLDNKEGRRTTRSMVGLKRKKGSAGPVGGELLVGEAALDYWGLAPRDTIVSIKRLMGRGVADPEVQRIRQSARYEIVEPSDGTRDSVRVVLGGQQYSPIEISTMILRKLKADAEFRLGEEVSHAVITVPAYFSQIQKDATRKAGRAAGLQVIKILDEPTAAAIAQGVDAGDSSEAKTIVVYDLGGGTFDVSVLMMAGGTFAPLDLEGDMWLGGDNFDRVLVEHIIECLRVEHPGLDPTANDRFMVELARAAQKTKEALGANRAADLIVGGLLQDEQHNLIDVDIEITREEFERMILPLVGRTRSLVERALQNAHVTPEQVDHVLMAGNSTAIPLVQRTMEEMFGPEKVLRRIHPKECVAMGAAIVAAVIGPKWACDRCEHLNDLSAIACERCEAPREAVEVAGQVEAGAAAAPEITIQIGEIIAIAPFNYGAQTVGDSMTVFVKKGDPVPTADPQMRVFRTQIPNARVIAIPIYGGENLERASANELQGDAFAILPPGLPAGTPVRVKLWLDRDGVFKLAAHLQDGQDLHPWVMAKGEQQQRAIQELEEVERLLGQKARTATPRDLEAVEAARERVFDQFRAGAFDAALAEVRELTRRAEEQDRVDSTKALRDKAQSLIGFTRLVVGKYSWAFDEARSRRLRELADSTERALDGDATVLAERVATINSATDDLPEVVGMLLGLRQAIHTRIYPFQPATAARLEQDLGRLEVQFAAGDMSGLFALNVLVGQVSTALKEIPELSAGTPCSRGHVSPPGERRCPECGDDKWILMA